MRYQVIKLSNGEDIIAGVEPIDSDKFKVLEPLKMSTVSNHTEKGVVESLGLSRWVQVYSDQPYYSIQKNSVVVMTPASEGLSRYYEYVLRSMVNSDEREPTDEELNSIELDEDMIDDDFLVHWDVDSKVYH